jgi:hypothetical protein
VWDGRRYVPLWDPAGQTTQECAFFAV